METKFVKVLDSGRRVLVDPKRKRAARSKTYFTGDNCMVLAPQSTLHSSDHKFSKRRKLDCSKLQCGWCSSQSKKSLLKYYSNFKRSSLPQRLMCYLNGEWIDFPQDLVSLISKDFQMKRATIEVELDGHSFVIDFLHMMKLDMVTGIQQPIAWIDESGNCFFPETFSDHGKINEGCYHEYEKDTGYLTPDPHGSNDIKLQLEIDITGLDFSNMNESSGESNDIVKQIQVIRKPASEHLDAEVDSSCVRVSTEEVCEAFGENPEENSDSDAVQEMFLKGLSLSKNANIVKVSSGGSGIMMKARRELFQKQVEITKRYRGDANVRYAWLPSSKGASSSVMTYGLGGGEISKIKSTYGIGVLLFPANCTQSSANYCDVDENGLQYMILCRVIMGNMEVVQPGLKQLHPSCEDFDSGVDDLHNPRHYIVWDMKKNTHIYPQYVVSFKASDTEGYLVGNENKLDISGVTTSCQGPEIQLQLISGSADMENDCHQIPVPKSQDVVKNLGSSSTRTPKSPWMPFTVLFGAISNNISPNNMNLVSSNYELFRSKKISREVFVTRLRMIVGDALLKSTIINLQRKGSSKSSCGEVAPEQVGSL